MTVIAETAQFKVHATEPVETYRHFDGFSRVSVAADYKVTVALEPPMGGDAYAAVRQAAEDSWKLPERARGHIPSCTEIRYLGQQALDPAITGGEPLSNDADTSADRQGDVVELRFKRQIEVDVTEFMGRFGGVLIDLASTPPEKRELRYPPFTVGAAFYSVRA